MAMKIKDNNSWKDVSTLHIKANGAWKEVSHAYVKADGAWQHIDLLPTYSEVPAYFYDSWAEGMEGYFDEGDEWHGGDRYLLFSDTFNTNPDTSDKSFHINDTFYVDFSEPPLQGYGSEKSCYIYNGGSWYKLQDAHKVNYGKYKITFTGKVFQVVE